MSTEPSLLSQQADEVKSPLSEIEPTSIDELFARDPESLTDNDIDKMVDFFRDNRKRWLLEDAAKQNAKGTPKVKKESKKISSPEEAAALLESLNLSI